jgi:hypothetical protein
MALIHDAANNKTVYGGDAEVRRDAAGVVALGATTAAAVKASTWVELTEITKPADPVATKLRLYVKAVSSATEIFTLDSAGVETNLTARLVTNGNSHDHIDGDGAAIAEGALSLIDVVTADVTTSRHGFAPKAPNDATKFLRGDATWDYTPSTLFATLQAEPTGFPNRTDSTISFNTTSREFTIAPTVTSFDFYTKGTKYTKSVAQTVTIDDTTGLWYIYFDASGVLQKSSTPWTIDGGIVPVYTVYWNSALADGRPGEERHGLVMDWATHQYFHECLGSRYVNGFGGTFGNTTFTITEGVYRDEDMRMVIGEQTQCRVLRRSGGYWTWTAKGADYYVTQSTNICYDNAGTLTEMGANAYVAYWFFVGNDPTCPIYVIMGQRTDTTLADARTNNTYDQLSLTNLPFAEMKVLFRVILRNDATPYEETQDLRSMAVVSSGTYVATDHNSMTNRGLLGAHPASAITVDASGFAGKLSATDVDVQTALGTLDAHTHAPPSGDTRLIYNDTGAWAVSTVYQLKASGYTGIGQAAPGERLHLKDGSGNGAIVIGAHENATAIAGTVEWNGTNVRWYTGAVWKNVGVDVTDPMTYKGALNCARPWTYTERQPAGAVDKTWRAIASDASGTNLVAAAYGGRLYTSSNSGAGWTERQPAGDADKSWRSIASDASEGINLIAAVYGGRLYTSANSGVGWTERQPAGASDQNWIGVNSGQGGTNLIAAIYGGRLYTSGDSGANWAEKRPAGDVNKNWMAVACDYDGTNLIAAVNAGRLYISSNSGTDWTEVQPGGATNLNWLKVASDSDGSVLMAAASSGRLYISTDSGANWTERQPAGNSNRNWDSVSCDSDGSNMIAVIRENGNSDGKVYTSSDSGATWSERQPAGATVKAWISSASDGDGSNLLVGVSGGRLYTMVLGDYPNYPAADAGDTYRVSVAGKIGGNSGPNVEAGDMMVCTTDSTPTGDHATVGAYWDIIQMNLDGAVVGPGSSTDHALVRWNSTTGTSALDSTVIVGDDGAVSLRGTAQQFTSYNNTILSLAGAGTGYARIGLSGTTSHTFNTDADLLVAGRLEVNGITYLDGNVEVAGTTTLATSLSGLLKATAGVVSAASAGSDYQAATTFQYSLTGTTTVNLVNDSATPGNTKLYGTNASGTKGWYDQPASSSGGGASSWTAMTPFTRTADSTFTVTDNGTNQGIFVPGRPLRYRATASTWRYGIVTTYSAGTVTIAGAPMTTNDDDELAYAALSNVVMREFRLDGYFAPVASTQLLADIMGQWARWEHGTAYLVRVVHRVESIDTGASQPRLNTVVNGNKVGTANSNNGWDVSGSAWVSSAVDISTTNYVVANAQALELSTDANGTNDDAMTASVQLVFVLE